jgi:hypothetical protein
MAGPTLRLIGAAAAFGVTAKLSYDGVIVSANEPQSHDLTDDFTKQDFMDGRGNIIGRAGHNRVRTATVEVIFSGDTEAQAKSRTKLPDDMFALVICEESGIAALDGQWNYEGGRYNGANGAYHRFTLNLWQKVGANGPQALALVNG